MPQTVGAFQPREQAGGDSRILGMKFMASSRFLTIYSGVLTAVFAVTILGGFPGPAKKSTFEEIYVQRINIVEPDGTLRMVLSGKSREIGRASCREKA